MSDAHATPARGGDELREELAAAGRNLALLQGDQQRYGAALRQCRDQFAFYAREHEAAGKTEKAATNAKFAQIADDALTAIKAARVASTDMAGAGEVAMPTPTILRDPNAVHANMLRGEIAKPSVEQIIHVYGRDALIAALCTPPVEGLTSGEGWQFVPVEPTNEMLEASADAWTLQCSGYPPEGGHYKFMRGLWSAMLAASPKATATASVREAHILTVAKAADYVVRFEAALEQQKADPSASLTYLASQAEVAVRYIKRLIALTDSGTADTHAGSVREALREVPDERIREIVDTLDVGKARALIGDLIAALHPVDSRAQGGEKAGARIGNSAPT